MPHPTFIVRTSPTKYQWVYMFPKGVPLEAFNAFRSGLRWELDGKDAVHWWRLPCGGHPKHPGFVTVLEGGTGPSYSSLDELTALLSDEAAAKWKSGDRTADLGGSKGPKQGRGEGPKQGRGKGPKHGRGPEKAPSVEAVESLLATMPNNLGYDYDRWVPVGIAIYGALGEEGRPLWLEWSYQQPAGEETPEDKWETFSGTHSAGWGALEIIARERSNGFYGSAPYVFDDGVDVINDPASEEAVRELLEGAQAQARKSAAIEKSRKLTLEDFRGYMPNSKCIFLKNGELWSTTSVNARVPPVYKGELNGKPVYVAASKEILEKYAVEQMTWWPGHQQIIKGKSFLKTGIIDDPGVLAFNKYHPAQPLPEWANAKKVARYIWHTRKLYPDDWPYILDWMAFKAQNPGIKINHALLLGGAQGIGKDTILKPLITAVGSHNFGYSNPSQLMERFNAYQMSVILLVSEMHDLGSSVSIYGLQNRMKTLTAAPPDMLPTEEKGIEVFYIPNIVSVVCTTNAKLDGIFLSEDDRRHYIAWSELPQGSLSDRYFNRLHKWLDEEGGREHVAKFLTERDISKFNPGARPPRTKTWHDIVDVNKGPVEEALADALDALGRPAMVTRDEIYAGAGTTLREWMDNRRTFRAFPARLDGQGYERLRNPDDKMGRWRLPGKRSTVYVRKNLPQRDRHKQFWDWRNQKEKGAEDANKKF